MRGVPGALHAQHLASSYLEHGQRGPVQRVLIEMSEEEALRDDCPYRCNLLLGFRVLRNRVGVLRNAVE